MVDSGKGFPVLHGDLLTRDQTIVGTSKVIIFQTVVKDCEAIVRLLWNETVCCQYQVFQVHSDS